MINFKTSKFEHALILKAAQRASKLAAKHGLKYPVLEADMDITACHVNGMPLDLNLLNLFDDGNFSHDAFGIRRHINRETGKIEDCFVPRCAMPRTASK